MASSLIRSNPGKASPQAWNPSDGFILTNPSSRSVIEGLLDSLPKLAAESGIVEAALGGPMCAAALSLVRSSFALVN